jgi:hypothetical protein
MTVRPNRSGEYEVLEWYVEDPTDRLKGQLTYCVLCGILLVLGWLTGGWSWGDPFPWEDGGCTP